MNKVISREYVEKNFIHKDVIRNKIQELLKQANFRTPENPQGRVHFVPEPEDYQIMILNEILEGTKDVLEEKENGENGSSNENNNTYAM